jgi:hypothetical protein
VSKDDQAKTEENRAKEDGTKGLDAGAHLVVVAGCPTTKAETLPPKLWPLMSTLRILTALDRFGT